MLLRIGRARMGDERVPSTFPVGVQCALHGPLVIFGTFVITIPNDLAHLLALLLPLVVVSGYGTATGNKC